MKKGGRKAPRKKALLLSLFFFPLFALILASLLAFFGCLLLGVLVMLSVLFMALVFRIALKNKSPWKARRSRATDAAILLFFLATLLGSYLLLVF